MEYKLILASASPRRHQLMCDAGFKFEVRLKHTEEIWPEGLAVEEVPEYLAGLKAKAFDGELKEGELLITADTVVCLDAKILGKPENREHAIEMLSIIGKKPSGGHRSVSDHASGTPFLFCLYGRLFQNFVGSGNYLLCRYL